MDSHTTEQNNYQEPTEQPMKGWQRMAPYVEIMDSTLRDGEQTNGVSFLPHEKLMIARKLLHDVNVDRIEVASARVSEGEREAVGMICRYAAQIGRLDRVEVLGFVDGGQSVDWIAGCGGRVVNLLAKGSLKHCTHQLHKTPEEHIADIRREVALAHERGLSVNLYLEDWSNGMKDSPDYVYQLMDALTIDHSPLTVDHSPLTIDHSDALENAPADNVQCSMFNLSAASCCPTRWG